MLLPPPKAAEIIQFLPGDFSTLELGLTKTGLLKAINDTSTHIGGTLFAPSNFAFKKLGPRINGFLFSKYGRKYLAALLKYHVVANQTLYSDAYYKAESKEVAESGVPKGYFHVSPSLFKFQIRMFCLHLIRQVDLQTLLDGRSLSVDVARYGRIIVIKINGFSTVEIADGIAKDGVIHVVNSVLIPPKSINGAAQVWEGEVIAVEDLKERLEPLITSEEL